MADDEVKSLLLQVLRTVEEIKTEHGRHLAEHGRYLAEHGQHLAEHGQHLANHGQRLTAIEAEQRQIKSMIGGLVVKEVARLDGRIDQLAQDTALGRRSA
ncbi:conserved hypothetical protein [uncultured Gammaproteobacteria bacterium]